MKMPHADMLFHGKAGDSEARPKRLLCSRRAAKFLFFIVLITAVLTCTRYFLKSNAQEVELTRTKRMIATHGAACGDIGHLGGVMKGDVTEIGFWNICLDPEMGLEPLSCLAYSFGTTDQWSFEKDLTTNLGCQVMRFDPLSTRRDSEHQDKRMVSHSFPLLGMSSHNSSGGHNLEPTTLQSILSVYGHQKRKIDILKLNLSKGEEWDVLSHLLKEGTLARQVKQLLFTVDLDSMRENGLILWQTAIHWLNLQGFRLFNRNKGPLCDNCYELSWVNKYI